MRVGIDGLLLWGCFSGVERSIARIAAALPAVDPEGEYSLTLPADGAPQGLAGTGLSLHRAPVAGRRKLARILWQQWAYPRALRRQGVELLFAPGYVLPLRWRGPSVLVVYDVIALAHPELARPSNVWHYRLVLPPSVRRASRVVVPSATVAGEVVRWCRVSPAKVTVVPLGVDAAFRPVTDPAVLSAVRERLGLPERFALYVGNLEPKKNLPRLLEAFSRLQREGLRHRLVLAGKPGWGVETIQADVARLGLAKKVLMPGFVPDADLPALYSLADLVVQPSLVEGFGLPPLEAMACGTPVLVADAPPFSETVGDAAIRVGPNDTDAIAAGMRSGLCDEDLRRRLREAGLRHSAGFTWEATAGRLVEIFREVMGEKAR